MRAETSATSAVATLSVAVAVVGHVLVGGSASLAAVPQLLALAAIAWILGEHLTGRRWLTVAVLAALQLITHLTMDAGHSPVAAPAASPHLAMDAAAMDAAAVDAAAMSHSSMHEMTVTDHAAMGNTAIDHAAMGHAGMAMPMPAPEPLAGAVPAAGESAASMHGGLVDAVTMSAAHLFVVLAGILLVGSTHRWVQRVLRILARLVPQLPAAAVTVPGTPRSAARRTGAAAAHPALADLERVAAWAAGVRSACSSVLIRPTPYAPERVHSHVQEARTGRPRSARRPDAKVTP